MILTDANKFISSLQTTIPEATDSLQLRITNLNNVSLVRPLHASFDVFITDSLGGQIAHGTSVMPERDILSPALFKDISVVRSRQDMATVIDLRIELPLNQIEIPPGSELELFIPKD